MVSRLIVFIWGWRRAASVSSATVQRCAPGRISSPSSFTSARHFPSISTPMMKRRFRCSPIPYRQDLEPSEADPADESDRLPTSR